MKTPKPDWRWGTAEGSREFDRVMDARLSLREKVQWLEDMETLHERFAEVRAKCLSENNTDRSFQG
jgi:hypothetical protein